MERGLLPPDRRPRGRGQRQERRALARLEDDQGLLLDRAMDSAAGDLQAPAPRVLVGVMEVAAGAAGEAVALAGVDAALFDLPLVLGRPGPAGGEEEAGGLRALPRDPLHLRIVPRGAHDGGVAILQDDAARDPAKPLEGGPVQPAPGGHRLVEDALHVLVAAVGQRHHERPGAAQAVERGIEQEAGEAEIDLRFLARLHLEPHRGARPGRLQAAEDALHRRGAP
jgi:hypothetical protein